MHTINSRLTRQHFGNMRMILEKMYAIKGDIADGTITTNEELGQRFADMATNHSVENLLHMAEGCRDIANSTDLTREPISVIIK